MQETLPAKPLYPWWKEQVIRVLLRALLWCVPEEDLAGPSASPPPPSGPQPSHTLPEDKRVLLEQFDNFADLRNKIQHVAGGVGEWAGVPMPLEGMQLDVNPTYKFAEVFKSPPVEVDPTRPEVKLRNHWWSDRLRADIYIFEQEGKIVHVVDHIPHVFEHSFKTLGCSLAWGLEQEAAAVRLLASYLPHHTFKMYLLTGMFLETSKRSGLTYLFRKLRPTVVLDARTKDSTSIRILCALCLHPIAYYKGSWAGAMTPTDDVIAHLILMRGDEPMFWKRANQHHPGRPEAGL